MRAQAVESQVVSFIVPDLAIPVPARSKDRYQGHQRPCSGHLQVCRPPVMVLSKVLVQ
jgi:hypothetical protein